MDLSLQNKTIVVTGGASGIGSAICMKLAEEGAMPCIADRDEKKLREVAEEIAERFGVEIVAMPTELTDYTSCSAMIAAVTRKFGRVDGLVNNAGLNDGVSLQSGNAQSFIQSLEKNVVHYFSMASLALPELKRSRGSIVNICSKTAVTGQGGTSGYAAANGERLALTSAWAVELEPSGINVNAVVVAECWTPQYKWWISRQDNPEKELHAIVSKIPLGNRMTTCDEVADTVLYLLSRNAKTINGQFLFVDGGYVFLDRAIKPDPDAEFHAKAAGVAGNIS